MALSSPKRMETYGWPLEHRVTDEADPDKRAELFRRERDTFAAELHKEKLRNTQLECDLGYDRGLDGLNNKLEEIQEILKTPSQPNAGDELKAGILKQIMDQLKNIEESISILNDEMSDLTGEVYIMRDAKPKPTRKRKTQR
jgi:hypothetical protein